MEDNQLKLERWPAWRRKIPYGKVGVGYKVDPEDPYNIIPDPEQIIFLEQAFDYIDKGSSLREVCEWLQQKLLRSLVHQTVSNLYRDHRKPFLNRKTNRTILNGKVKRSKESLQKAAAKAKITNAKKRYEKLLKEPQRKIPDEDFPEGPQHRKEPYRGGPQVPGESRAKPPVPNDVSLVFVPNPGPQMDFLSATEEEVLYGGSAGGEPKSWFTASFPSNRSK